MSRNDRAGGGERGGGRTPWLLPALLLLCCLPPLVIDLEKRGPKHFMEGIALLTAQETWIQQSSGVSDAWLRPTNNGSFRLNKPPMLIWLDMLAFTGLDPESSTTPQVILRARLVTVGLGLVLAASIFWIGMGLGDRKLGLFGALIALATPLMFQEQARMASYDMHMAAWAALACAGAVWAMRPFGPRAARSQAVIGWSVAGLAMGLACMSKNPSAILYPFILVAAALVLDKQRHGGRLLGFASALLLCIIVTAPWYLYHYQRDPQAVMAIWGHEYSAVDSPTHGPHFYIILLRLALPWSVFIIGGLVHPFMFKGAERRRRLLVWSWFVALLVIHSVSRAQAPRYIFPIMPALALLIAQVFADHQRMAERGEVDRGALLLTIPHWLIVLGISVLFSFGLQAIELAPMSRGLAITLAIVLLLVAFVGFRRHLRFEPAAALAVMVLWTSIFATTYWRQHARSEDPMAVQKAVAERIALIVGDAPLRCLLESTDERPDNEFLLYYRRIVRGVRPSGLQRWADRADEPVFIMANATEQRTDQLDAAGFEVIHEFEDRPERERRLWVHDGADSP